MYDPQRTNVTSLGVRTDRKTNYDLTFCIHIDIEPPPPKLFIIPQTVRPTDRATDGKIKWTAGANDGPGEKEGERERDMRKRRRRRKREERDRAGGRSTRRIFHPL